MNATYGRDLAAWAAGQVELPRAAKLSIAACRAAARTGILAVISGSPGWRLLAAAMLAVNCAGAGAVTQHEVADDAARVYAGRIAALRASHQLDTGRSFSQRVQRIARSLFARAATDYPETAAWQWEVHTTTDPEQGADCMAGGKLLVGQRYVEELELNDAELAMLLAHEIEHAAQRHNLKEYELALRLDASWAQRPFADLSDAVDNDRALMAQLAPLNFAQEAEADREGLRLAWRAGWPAARLANYFRKLVRASWQPNFDSSTHPSPASRWRAARTLATALEAQAAAGNFRVD